MSISRRATDDAPSKVLHENDIGQAIQLRKIGGSMRDEKTCNKLAGNYVTKAPKELISMSEIDPTSTKASSTLSGKKSASHTSADGWSDESTRDPTEAMIKRWILQLQKTNPTVDLIDISA